MFAFVNRMGGLKEARGALNQNRQTPDAAHTRWWQIGEVVFGLPLAAALALQWLAPLPLSIWLGRAGTIAGAALLAAGVALIALGRRALARHGQPTDPGQPTGRLVTGGVFGYSRNPLYLGAACLMLGGALAGGVTWIALMLIPALVACHYVLIQPEERYLAARFGDEYRAYAARVGRWFGRRRG